MAMKSKKVKVENTKISIETVGAVDYISITDMARYRNSDRTNYIIQNWMRSRSTIEFLGLWEQLNNPGFKSIEFEGFMHEAGSNSFSLTPKRWIESTGAIGITSKSGRYGGTFAHKDIAFEFGSWISPTFKLYLLKEYQRLKEIETNKYNLEWNVTRVLSKVNYHLQTDAVKKHILPKFTYKAESEWLAYAEEADLLNVALFGCTAGQWREANADSAAKGQNMRDFASINELAILSNLEAMNSEMIKDELSKATRFQKLRDIAAYQLNVLNDKDFMKALKRTSDDVYLNDQN